MFVIVDTQKMSHSKCLDWRLLYVLRTYKFQVLRWRNSLFLQPNLNLLFRGVLPIVVRRCVGSRNLMNEEAMSRVGPQRHKK